ncbi:glycogen debranching protein GlgX [Methylorubrum extorquens]|uniref:Glycogen debranching protein GlgX n=1 Tax=Methylorubrum extorquens TaxID=408 RepID=A0AAX3WBM6_METEX|nr:glycogen debranching protein GlgX [Methylorubrum extorquens]UYW30760.1 glycogen debranching protein GlgX [Methylorubrum extorquens]WHQ68149.1 glycogen debranching protein GlgX [Methylorubrum extorquens]
MADTDRTATPRPRTSRTRIREGSPHPRGATWDGRGVNFALFSAHATKVELCLFDDAGENEIERIDLPEYTDEVWHGYLPDARPGTIYGYRVHGPYEPEAGHRFNPNKLLIDPYAKGLVGTIQWNPALFGYKMETGDDLTFDERDSAPYTRRSRVIDPAFTWGRDVKPRVPWERTIIYETHVKGFTKLHPAVPEKLRGTYAGLGNPAVLDYIKSLGVTSVELLPVHSFVQDDYLQQKHLINYWGYNTISFFTPARRYAAVPDFAFSEFKEMVARMHGAGLEVILDVVYNHTAEGNEKGPTLSFKGVDNASYYRLLPNQPRYYINDTGTGNTFNLSHPRVLQLVTDSLRYWATEMRVDGFRFDLATILGREPYGFDEGGGFLDTCRQDPVLNDVKLIAEPWDCGPGGYQVGGFPPGWAEWNDRFRDDVRGYWKGDAGLLPGLASRITASADKFNKRGRRPWASVNFITAHDGFTLNDTVSYNEKHNQANEEGNRDGHGHNLSYNYGVEGPTDDPEIRSVRLRQMRNMLATLFLSKGTPMLLAGDEFARTQKGNNNAYCQDNEVSWVDWGAIGEEERDLAEFTQRLILLRNALPMLSRGRFVTGAYDEEFGVKDVTWLTPTGTEMSPENWNDGNSRTLAVLLDGRAQASGIHKRGGDATLLLFYNAYHDVVDFTLPEAPGGTSWTRLLDTNLPDSQEVESFAVGESYSVTGRSMLMFVLKPVENEDEDEEHSDMERSYQYVMQAFERANVESVSFGIDEEA